jgi:hypothetical protein
MATRIATLAAKTGLDAITALLNSGTVEIRTGSQPATVGTAASGTLLGTLSLSATAFGAATTASPAVATANAITGDTSADATGTAGWFRAYRSSGNGSTAIIDGSITASGGGGDMIMSSVSVVAGGTLDVTAWTISQPTA